MNPEDIKFLPAPNPENFLPWKLEKRAITPQNIDEQFRNLLETFDTQAAIDRLAFDFAPNQSGFYPLYEIPESVTIQITPMSRKFDRTQKIQQTSSQIALETLKASIRQRPWYIPKFIWFPIYFLAAKIVFK